MRGDISDWSREVHMLPAPRDDHGAAGPRTNAHRISAYSLNEGPGQSFARQLLVMPPGTVVRCPLTSFGVQVNV